MKTKKQLDTLLRGTELMQLGAIKCQETEIYIKLGQLKDFINYVLDQPTKFAKYFDSLMELDNEN